MYLSPLFSSQSKSFVIATRATQWAETCFSSHALLEMLSVRFQWLACLLAKSWDANHVPFLVELALVDGRRLGTKFHIRYVKVSSFFRELQHQRDSKIDRGDGMEPCEFDMCYSPRLLYKRVLSSPYLIFSRRGRTIKINPLGKIENWTKGFCGFFLNALGQSFFEKEGHRRNP